VLHTELASALYGHADAPLLVGFVGGLGGRDISPQELFEMVRVVEDAVHRGETPPPRLLYTQGELREMRKLQAVARVERNRLGEGA